MSAVTLWTGPVANFQVPGCSLPGSTWPPSLNCWNPVAGVTPPAGIVPCAQMVSANTDADGRLLPSLLRSRGLDFTQVDVVAMGSFSAGQKVISAVLASPADRALVKVVTLADSMFSSGTAASPVVPQAYLSYALDCLGSDRIFVATVSAAPGDAGTSAHPVLPSGSDVMKALVAEIEKRSGRKFTVSGPAAGASGFGDTTLKLPPVFAGITPAPQKLYSLGSVLFADYGMTVPHGEHASKLAPQVWRNVVIPWWTAAPAPPGPSPVGPPVDDGDEGPGTLAKVFAFLGGAAAGYAGVRAWRRRS